MGSNRVNTIKGTVAKAVKNGATAKSAKTPAGPTIGGVQGVGVATTPKRPDSSRRPRIVTSHTTRPTPTGLGEGKGSEATANMQLGQTARMKVIKAYYKPKHQAGGMNDYYAHNANATKKTAATNEQVEVGDHVKLGDHEIHAGAEGEVVKCDGDHHQVKLSDGAAPWVHKTQLKKVAIKEEAPAMSVANGAVAGVAPPDPTVDFAAQKLKKIKKLAMAKRAAPKGE